jgi:hypothetical protein
MVKISNDPITVADLEEFVDNQDDFALELDIYSTAKSLGKH